MIRLVDLNLRFPEIEFILLMARVNDNGNQGVALNYEEIQQIFKEVL